MNKQECHDCGNSAELTEYDDTFEDPDAQSGYAKGYFHGWMLCQKCSDKHDETTLRMYDELAKEREELRHEGMQEL